MQPAAYLCAAGFTKNTPLYYSMRMRSYFSSGDVGAFFGVLADAFSKISIVIAVLLFAEKMPAALVLGRILPGIAVSSIAGSIVYVRQAYKLSIREHKSDVTALPFGISSTQTLAWLFIIIVPVYRQTGNPYFAWTVGLASCFVGGLIEIASGFAAPFIRRFIPRSALVGNMAAASLVWLSFNGFTEVFSQPRSALVPLFIAFLTLFYTKNLIPKVPNAVLILILGSLSAWLAKSQTSAQVAQAVQNVGWYPPVLCIKDIIAAFGQITPYLCVIVPLQISNSLSTMQAVESADAAGDSYPLRQTMIYDGLTTLAAAVFGSPFPTTVYYGHPAWKRSGAKSGYLLCMIIPYVLLFFGLPLLFIAFIPFQVIMCFLIIVGISVAVEVQNNLKKDYSSVIYLSLFPIFAQYVLTVLDNALHAAGSSVADIDYKTFAAAGVAVQGLTYLANGAFTLSFLYSVWIAYIIKKEYLRAGVTALLLSALSAIGFIHQSSLSLLPPGSFQFIVIYAVLALICMYVHIKNLSKKSKITHLHNSTCLLL